MIILFVTVDEVTAVMAAGYTTIRVYTDTTETGTFVTLDGTVALVADVESYSYTDLDGTEDTWYKTAYFGAGPGEGDKSDARKGETSKAYATVKELRNQIQMTGETNDVELALLLDSATASIDNFCNRSEDGFVAPPNATIRYFRGTGVSWVWIDECVAITTVAVKDAATDATYTAWTSPTTDYAGDGDWIPFTGEPEFPEFGRLPYTAVMTDPNGDYSTFTSGRFATLRGFRPLPGLSRNVPTVAITARWGYSATIPYAIKQACLTQAARWYKRGSSAWADAMASAELGELRYTKPLDPAIQHLLVDGRMIRPAIGIG